MKIDPQKFDPQKIDLGAEAIANERGGRRGMPPITNVLALLPEKLVTEVREDTVAVLEAVGYAELCEALAESVKMQTHYAKLLNAYDGGSRLVFRSTEEWLTRLRETKGQ